MTTLPAGTNLLYRRHTITLPCDVAYSADKSTAIIGSAKMALTLDLSTIIWISDKELKKLIHDLWFNIIKEKGLPKYTLKAGTPVMYAGRPILTTRDYAVYVTYDESVDMKMYQSREDSDGYIIVTHCCLYGPDIQLELCSSKIDDYPELHPQWNAAELAYKELTYASL